MSFPKLTFPLIVDFCSGGCWIGDHGPFKYGAATTAFFIGENLTETGFHLQADNMRKYWLQ